MGAKPDGSELVNDKKFQNMLAQMDDDTDEAEKQWKAQLKNPGFGDFPSDFLADYKSDGTELVKSRGTFNAEWNKVVVGRGDPKRLLTTYEKYSENLELLRESNARFKALIDAKLAAQVAAWLLLMKGFANAGLARVKKLEQELEELQEILKEADKEVSDVKLKRIINVGLSAVTLVLAPEAVLAKVLVIAGGITAHVIVDNVLGHGTVKGGAVFVAGDGVEAVEELSHGAKKFVGVSALFITFKFDSDEVEEVEEILHKLQSKFESAQRQLEDLVERMTALVPKLKALDVGIKNCAQEVKRAMTRSADADKNYKAIKEAIKDSLKP